MLPNFFIVGAPKAGTTSLFFYLKQHPEIFLSNPKELNFFSAKEIISQGLYYNPFIITGLEKYETFFSQVKGEKAIGEASVSYLFYNRVPNRIINQIPDAKIIIMLRDPVKRGFSHYLMDKRLGYVKCSFEDVIFRRVKDRNLDLYYQQYIELGFYFEQVKRYIEVFGIERVKIIIMDQFKSSPGKIICEIFRFLNVDENFVPDMDRKYNTFLGMGNRIFNFFFRISFFRFLFSRILPGSAKSFVHKLFSAPQKPVLKKNIEEHLYKLYRDDISSLEKVLNIDLSCWKNG